jgi:glycosyltransferase involved in cell wall biosynthesis
MVIATFAPDEPIREIIEAAFSMPEVNFVVSGNPSRSRALGVDLPTNVHLTGFLPDQLYWEQLARADVICDLTLMSDCLVCGAYEGLALAKPMVLSDNAPTRDLFGTSAILTESNPGSIAEALCAALEKRELLQVKARDARDAFRPRWEAQATLIWEAIQTGAAKQKAAKTEKAEA